MRVFVQFFKKNLSFCYLIVCRNGDIIKSSKDTRYVLESAETHDGIKHPSWTLPDLTSFQAKTWR